MSLLSLLWPHSLKNFFIETWLVYHKIHTLDVQGFSAQPQSFRAMTRAQPGYPISPFSSSMPIVSHSVFCPHFGSWVLLDGPYKWKKQDNMWLWWLLSDITPLRFIHVITWTGIHSFALTRTAFVLFYFFLPFISCWTLDCISLLTMTNKAIMCTDKDIFEECMLLVLLGWELWVIG